MKWLCVVIFLFASSTLLAQRAKDAKLKSAVAEFDLALVSKDSLKLKKILCDKLSYGHSNGWIQSKRQLIDDLYNGKITYKKVRCGETEVTEQKGTAWVRSVADIDTEMEGKPMTFKLRVLQVWIKQKGKWRLFARQSVKY